MSRRIGVLGGMFDPVHTGHIEVAVAVQSQLQLDEVRLVPCAIPNHKTLATAGASHRVNMLQLAIDGKPGLIIDERELHREGTSYTVDTLAEMHNLFPRDCLVFIQGDDSFRTLPQWHQWRQLLKYAHLCVMSRRTGHSEAGYAPELDALVSQRGVATAETLFEQQQGNIPRLDDVYNPVSSTQLREALQLATPAGLDNRLDHWLDPRVLSYIEQHRLYHSE